MASLVEQGTDPHIAQELALAELLAIPEDEQDRTKLYELEGANQSMMAAVQKHLLSGASANPPVPTTPPT